MAQPYVEMSGIYKAFPGVQALAGADFSIFPGEIHGLIGENGAGKSVLIKTLLGVHQKDAGEIFVDGKKTHIRNPIHAHQLGLNAVYQDIMLAPQLSVAENICLGRHPCRFGLVSKKEMKENARKAIERLGVSIDLEARVGDLSVAQQEMVAIAKALATESKVLAFDEPTAMLSNEETGLLFSVMRKLKDDGVSMIYISHRLEEVFEICDRATVLRDGRSVGTIDVKNVDRSQLIKMMVGRDMHDLFFRGDGATDDEILRVENLSRGVRFRDVSFSLKKGEVLGVFGLIGSGRTDVMRAIFGAEPVDSGMVFVEGRAVCLADPTCGIRSGIALVPEDRKNQGLAIQLSVKTNINLASYRQISRFGVVSSQQEIERAKEYVDSLSIKTPDLECKVQYLSGGNQQKVVIAKWLNVQSKVVILDEPTVGLDIGAKREIYELIARLTREGAGVIFVSSYLPEVIGVSDRILVMCNGRVTGEVDQSEATEDRILDLAFRF